MAFFCLTPRTGVIIVIVLNLLIGLPIVIEYLLGRLEVVNRPTQTLEKLTSNTTDPQPPVLPLPFFLNKSGTGNDTLLGNETDCDWICWLNNTVEPIQFYTGWMLILVILVLAEIAGVLSLVEIKVRKQAAHAACLLVAALVGVTLGNCLMMFVFGYHWLDLLPIFAWCGVINVYFAMVHFEYRKTMDFHPVPVSA